MITDTKKGGQYLSDAVAYAVYCITAKDHPEAKHNERVLLVQSENLLLPPPPPASDLKACRAWGQLAGMKIEEWTKDKRNGRPMPKSLFQSGSVSFSESDSKNLTPAKALEIAREAVAEVMLGNRAILWSVHGDTTCLHVHFEASSTDDTGAIWNPRFDFRLWESEMERLEIKYRLERVTQRKVMAKHDQAREIRICAPTRAELEITMKNGSPSPKALALAVLNSSKKNTRTISEFFDAVESVPGYEIVPNGTTGKCSGYSLRCPDGVTIKGSDFGKAYSFIGLQKGGISYEQDRDFEAISRRRDRAISRAFGSSNDSFDNHSTTGSAIGCPPGGITAGIDGNGPDSSKICISSAACGPVSSADVRQSSRTRIDPERKCAGFESPNSQGKVSVGRDRRDIVSDCCDRGGSDSAVRKISPRKTGSSDHQGSPATTTAIERQILAWERQCKALGLSDDSEIRVMLVDREPARCTVLNPAGAGGMLHPEVAGANAGWQRKVWRQQNGGEVRWTISEVRKAIQTGRFAALNGRKFDVFMRPYEPNYHYLFIDDTDPNVLKSFGYTPCLVQESSPGNYQCVLKIPRKHYPAGSDAARLEKRAANALALSLNTRFGDRNAGRIDQIFRVAGFANKKPNRNDFFTKIDWGSCKLGLVCNVADAELEDFRSAVKIAADSVDATDPESFHERMPVAEPEEVLAHAAFNWFNRHNSPFVAAGMQGDIQDMAREIRKWATIQGKNKVPDWSAVDFLACRELAKKGWNAERLGNALFATSPALHDRKRGHEGDYIKRTVSAAFEVLAHATTTECLPQQQLQQQSYYSEDGPTI